MSDHTVVEGKFGGDEQPANRRQMMMQATEAAMNDDVAAVIVLLVHKDGDVSPGYDYAMKDSLSVAGAMHTIGTAIGLGLISS